MRDCGGHERGQRARQNATGCWGLCANSSTPAKVRCKFSPSLSLALANCRKLQESFSLFYLLFQIDKTIRPFFFHTRVLHTTCPLSLSRFLDKANPCKTFNRLPKDLPFCSLSFYFYYYLLTIIIIIIIACDGGDGRTKYA